MNIIPVPGLIALQLIPFLITLVALHYILFKPMLAYLEEREAAIDLPGREATELREKVAADLATWELRVASARTEMAAERARLHEEAQQAGNRIINESRAKADGRVALALSGIQESRDSGFRLLQSQASSLATEIASRILSRPVIEG